MIRTLAKKVKRSLVAGIDAGDREAHSRLTAPLLILRSRARSMVQAGMVQWCKGLPDVNGDDKDDGEQENEQDDEDRDYKYSDDHCQKQHVAHVAVGHANATILTATMTMTTVPYWRRPMTLVHDHILYRSILYIYCVCVYILCIMIYNIYIYIY